MPEKPGVQLRASSYLATGKYPFVRIEQEIEILPSGQAKVLKTVEMVGDQIIVKLPEGSSAEEIQSLAAKLGGQAAAKPFAPDTWLVALPRKLEAVPEALAGTTNSGVSINYAEPNHLVRPMRSPNDPRFTNFNQWHLYNNSQLGVDIKAAKAWDRRTSASSGTTNKVIVAVIDSGVRYTHEDLLPNMWTNPGEILGDGWDNDGNGLVDDIYGADYLGNDGDPITTDSHGTHCAGLIAGVGNNGLGITGVAWSGVQIMALRFIDVTGSTDDNVQCIDYAISKGAKIINASYGAMYNPNRTEMEAIKRAENSGIIMVAAAGNGTDEPYTDQNANQRYDSGEPFTDWNSSGTWDKWHNNDTKPFYPASYSTHTFPRSFFTPATTITLNNIISVGATDRNDNKPSFSNFGADSVDLMAPGVEMWSTSISGTSNSYYASSQGTSFAAPVVAGALALLIAEYPNDTVSQRVARVVNTNAVDVVPALSGLCKTGGRLNLAKLLPTADVSTLPQALAWHRPSHSEPLINSPMRTPSPILLSNDVTIFSGLKKFNNTNGINTNGLANQTGGWLFYRTSGTNAWSSNALAFHTNSGDYQFWKATLPSVSARTYEYYLQLDFDSGARTTFLHYSNSADEFATTTTQTTAQASPYSFTVPKTAASITLAGLNQTYNGSAQSVSITTSPPGLSYTVTYDGTSSAPTNAGTYNVVATITDPNYEGSSTSTLIVAKAPTSVSIAPTASSIRLGQTLADSSLNGGVASVQGSFSFTQPTLVPTLGTSSYPVKFTPDESSNYLDASTNTSVTVGGILDPSQDSDGDGISNLLEHALAGFSTPPSTSSPLGLITTQSLEGTNGPETILSLVVAVRTDDPALTIEPEASFDLASETNWIANGFSTDFPDQTDVPPGFELRQYRFHAGTNSRAFIRLKVQQQ
ncbi:MAG: S8 family serine peptidase [Verrucomicrobia bacterium]|nr:S8 family serine peptidase [Verrucomicrobiota bacterium]